MKNGLFKLKANDFVKGLATAVFAAIVTAVYKVVSDAGFDFFGVDYVSLGKLLVNVGGAAFIGYLMKNFFSTNDGSVLGITPEDKK